MPKYIERVLRAVEQSPWAIQPEKLEMIAGVLIAKAQSGQIPDAAEIEAADKRTQRKPQGGAVAVLPVYGTIARRMGMLAAMSGGVSLERFGQVFDDAVNDESVSTIVLNVDSPGGSVYGVEEMGRKIFDARKKKRIVAVADPLAASAAYWIGSAAEEFVITPSGEAGSIGVYAVHFDWSAALEKEGVKATVIRAGEHKAEGNPYEPLGDDALAHMQSQIDDYYALFTKAVAKYRGVSVETVRGESFGQGRTLTAKRAVDAGLADRVATFEEVVSEETGKPRRGAMVQGADLQIAAVDPREWRATLADAVAQSLITTGTATAGILSEAPITNLVIQIAQPNETKEAATDGAVTAADPVTPEPAPEAKEQAMPPEIQDTAARTNGAATRDAEAERQAEMQRRAEIRQMGRDYNVPAADVDQWIDNGASVESVQSELFRRQREQAKAATKIAVGADREAEKPFASLGEQLQAIRYAGMAGHAPDRRLLHLNEQANRHAQATGTATNVPSDAGFVIQPEFAEGIVSHMWEEGRVLARTNNVPIGPDKNRFKRNHLAESSRRDGSRYGGVRVYRAAEAHTVEASKPKLRPQEISLEKLLGLWYVTEETLEDATALTAEGERAFRREMTFVVENEIFRGSGTGECLGFLTSGALVTVDPQTTDDQTTRISPLNIGRMVAQFGGSLGTAVFYTHRGLVPDLMTMKIGSIPVFVPNQNVSGTGFGTLLGVPVELSEYCEAPGTPGDICLVDLSQYTTIDKRGVRWENSIHVRFVYDESVFKIAYRINGQPDWDAPIQQHKGDDPVSPFVVLDTLDT